MKDSRPRAIEIRSKEDLDRAIERCPEARLRAEFDSDYNDSAKGLQEGLPSLLSSLVSELEWTQIKDCYKAVHGGLPEVRIESMSDVDRLCTMHSHITEWPRFRDLYEECRTYFSVREEPRATQKELAQKYDKCDSTISRYLRGLGPRLVSELGRLEEASIIREWITDYDSEHLSLQDTPTSDNAELTRVREGLLQIFPHRVNETLRADEGNRSLLEQVITLVQQEGEGRGKASSWIRYVDLRQVSGISTDELRSLEHAFMHDREVIDQTVRNCTMAAEFKECPRLAYLEGRLYIWQRSSEVANLVRAYEGQYFYLSSNREMAKLLIEAKEALHGTREGGLYGTKQHLDRLIEQMFEGDTKAGTIDLKRSRIRAEHLELILDIIGQDLTCLEGRVNRLCGENGKGGIQNPRFPEGEVLKATLGRCIATAATDCHTSPHGTVEYCEPEMGRIRKFEADLQLLGDIKLNPRWSLDKSYYRCYVTSPIGKLAQHYGIPAGDKAVLNPKLPMELFRESVTATRAFVGDVIPQEGSVTKTSISWIFSNVLNPGSEDLSYGISPVLTKQEVDFIRGHGKPGKDCRSLSWSDLPALQKSESMENIQLIATIESKVNQNPSNLAHGTGALIRSLGVKIDIRPSRITYYEKTDRVSVSWAGRTYDPDEAMKLGMAAPPNDVKKREKVRRMICERAGDVSRLREELAKSGLEIEEWWTE